MSETPQMNVTMGVILSVLFLFFLNNVADQKTAWDIVRPLLP